MLGAQGLIWECLQREQLLGAGSDLAVGQGITDLVRGNLAPKWGPGGAQSWAGGAWGAPGRKGLGQCVTHRQGPGGDGRGGP